MVITNNATNVMVLVILVSLNSLLVCFVGILRFSQFEL